MDNFTFYSPTLYEFGRGAEEKTGMLTFLMGVNKVMIVFGKKYVNSVIFNFLSKAVALRNGSRDEIPCGVRGKALRFSGY